MRCTICHRRCTLAEGQLGFCGARKNQAGQSVCINYGQVTALALDPIEKKPLYHFHPGSAILSVGSFGCNMACPFCQNHTIAEARLENAHARYIAPEPLVETALSLTDRGNIGLAFTYNEPMIGFEYVRDAAKLAKQRGLQTAVVTNGCVSQAALLQVLPYVDAFNIDLKCFTPAGYRRLGGGLAMVQAFIRTAYESAHVELTTLIVPGLNDGEDEMRDMTGWIASLSPEIPYHISRFFPHKQMLSTPPTAVPLLRRLCEIAKERLHAVYLGNV